MMEFIVTWIRAVWLTLGIGSEKVGKLRMGGSSMI